MERRRRKRNKTAGATDRIMLGSAYDLLNTIPKCDEHRTGRLTYPVSSGRIGAGLTSKARTSEQYRTSKRVKGVPDLTFSSMDFFRGLAKREKQTRRREKQMVTTFSATSSTAPRRDIEEKDIKRTTEVLEEAITRALRRLGEDKNVQHEPRGSTIEMKRSEFLSSDGMSSTVPDDEMSRRDTAPEERLAPTSSIMDEEETSQRSAYSQARRSEDKRREKLGPGKEIEKEVIRASTKKSVVVDVGSMPWSADRLQQKLASGLVQVPSTRDAPLTDEPLSSKSTVTADAVQCTETQAGPRPGREDGAKATPMLAYGPHGPQQPANAWKARHARSDSLEAWELREIANENAKRIRLDYGPPVPGLVASPFYVASMHSARNVDENITIHNAELGQIGDLEREGEEEEVSQYGVKEEEKSRCSTCGGPDEILDVGEAQHLIRYEEVDGSERPFEEVRRSAYPSEQIQQQDFVHPQYEDERECEDEMQHEELPRLHSIASAPTWSSHDYLRQEQATEGVEGLFRPAWLHPGLSSLAARHTSFDVDQDRPSSHSHSFTGQNGRGSDSLLVPQDQLKGFWKPFRA
ncbi:hypothetical protein FA10DRAFT_175659 [Acaromyces ingoldii]|uniref:Uncharacterized protein n=1 Tax=Acaromyces ingoldii TaxID=215250 RepID=A0A316YDR2_9BASI|nr:hypothetical protein FA10DRAFT_175659 [Acaromyces ingoldii]PWN87740.1 hypothetical protein FA10DRAFT_175659 [Acaromyces ingoldii]